MIERINEKLDFLIEKGHLPQQRLYEAARYSLFSGGKRIRPLLALETGQLLGASLETLLVPACALELIHTYSLIHDDLPAMDDDDFRRGQLSLHKAYDEATAILTGDFLLTYAFELLATAPLLSPEIRLSLIHTLSRASGGEGMVGGQLLDIYEQGSLDEINAKKTGALFKASVEFGAIIGGAPKRDFERLSLFGEKFGALFQCCDDILDGDQTKQALTTAEEQLHEIEEILSSLENASALRELSRRVLHQLYSACV